MVKVFKQMLDSQAFVDCTLACEGKLIKAHKMILAACSPYLHTILEENTSKHPIIFLPHLKYTDIRALVDYMYCGEVYISFGHLPSLLKAAEVLRIKGLTDVDNGSGGGGTNAHSNNTGAAGSNISSSSDLHNQNNINNNNNSHSNNNHNHHHSSSSGDTSGTSSASNLLDQACDVQTQQSLGASAAAAAAVAAAAASGNLGQLLGNNLSNLLGAANNVNANNNSNNSNSIHMNNNNHNSINHHHLSNHHLDNGDCSNETGNINNKSTSNLLEQSYEDEENEYDLGPHLTLDPEVSFVDDCSNEDVNNEDANGESHSKLPNEINKNLDSDLHRFLTSFTQLTNTTIATDKTFLCHLCRCSFTAQSSLRRHMHRHFTDRERFECEICHNSYSRKDYLKEHKKTKHQIST